MKKLLVLFLVLSGGILSAENLLKNPEFAGNLNRNGRIPGWFARKDFCQNPDGMLRVVIPAGKKLQIISDPVVIDQKAPGPIQFGLEYKGTCAAKNWEHCIVLSELTYQDGTKEKWGPVQIMVPLKVDDWKKFERTVNLAKPVKSFRFMILLKDETKVEIRKPYVREVKTKMNREIYSSLLKKSLPFMMENIRISEYSPKAASFGNGESINWPVQCTAKACSALIAIGETKQALPLLRYLLATHVSGRQKCSDGKKWGHTWIAAGGSLERLMSALYRIESELTDADRKALRRVLLSEADWILKNLPVLAGIDGNSGNNKPESNLWNGSFLIRVAMQYPDAPRAAEYRKKGEVLLVNGICTPSDTDPRKVGANFTENLSLDHHGYLNTGYMVICLMHIAILHYDSILLKQTPPPELYRHVPELWRLVKSCISPDGRLLRIGGDTRVRYAYCQSYLPLICRFAAEYLGDADALKLEKAALELLAKEQAGNADGSFFATRMSEIRWISPLYYLRCEADVLNMLAMGVLWPASAPASEKPEKIPVLNKWQDDFHGAVMIRTDKTLRSWVSRSAEGPTGLCVPLEHSDMAEWLHNMAGEVRTAGCCRAVEVRRNINGNSGCMELVWWVEHPLPEGEQRAGVVRQFLAFALLPDGRTMLAVNRMTSLKYFNVEGGDGINLKIPNDLFNGYKRTYTGVNTDRINADDAISLILLSGGKKLKVTESKKRNVPISQYPYFNSLKVDVLGLPVRARSVERGEVLADCSFAVVADSPASELPRFTGSSKRLGKDGEVIRWQDPRTGKRWIFTVDFANFKTTLVEE